MDGILYKVTPLNLLLKKVKSIQITYNKEFYCKDLFKDNEYLKRLITDIEETSNFSGNGYISVENKRNVVRQESVLSETLRVKIVLMDTPQLLAVLDTVAEWLTTQCEDVFMNDDLGHPIKIINPMLKVTCPLMLEALGITFKPCIVEDNIGTKYQGVAMGNREKGEIFNFTATEFIVFKNMMAYALNNLYTNNMLLATHTMQYCMYRNLMEVLNKNAQRNKPQ